MGIEKRLWMIMKNPNFLSNNYFSPDHIAFLLKKNGWKQKKVGVGKQVHAWLVNTGVNLNELSLNSKLVRMYASCGDLKSASLVFEKIQNPNVFALNWMVLASAYHGDYKGLLGTFV